MEVARTSEYGFQRTEGSTERREVQNPTISKNKARLKGEGSTEKSEGSRYGSWSDSRLRPSQPARTIEAGVRLDAHEGLEIE